MKPYTTEDLCKGAGAFEHAMRHQSTIPGTSPRMSPQVVVGVLSAAMRSGLPAAKMRLALDAGLGSDADGMMHIHDMFTGCDWDIHYWDIMPNGQYKLCYDLRRPQLLTWRFNPHAI